ncbi:MAG: vitamin K epoxide reductase family protein [Vicinamibacterales bacterium]
MTRRTYAWLLGFALLGLVASASSTYIHYRLNQDPSYTSICSVNQIFNCESAYTSRYGTIRGVSVALVGLIWFSLVALLLGAVRLKPEGEAAGPGDGNNIADNVAAYIYMMSTLGLGVVIYFAYASFFILQTVCVFCLATYVATIGLFIVSGGASAATMGSLPARLGRDLGRLVRSPAALVAALAFIVGSGAALAWFSRDASTSSSAQTPTPVAGQVSSNQQVEFDRWFSSEPRTTLPIPSDGAKVLIVKFNDYQCPSCAAAYFRHKSILEKYQTLHPGAVRFVSVDFPLAPECNPGVTNVVHPAACAGAVAVRLSRARGKGEAMEEWLYSHQQGLTPDDVRRASEEVAGVTDFDREYERVLRLVKQDAGLGNQLRITGTPTFFINGVRIDGGLRPEYLDAAIEHELKKAGVLND